MNVARGRALAQRREHSVVELRPRRAVSRTGMPGPKERMSDPCVTEHQLMLRVGEAWCVKPVVAG